MHAEQADTEHFDVERGGNGNDEVERRELEQRVKADMTGNIERAETEINFRLGAELHGI